MQNEINTIKPNGFLFWMDRFHVLIFFVLAFLLRLPLWNAGLPLNGDESILALMGKHLSEGQSVPLYFYGQQYGFTGLETLVLALGFKLGGVSDLMFRTGLLLIWAVGLSFFYRFLKNTLRAKTSLGYIWLICLCMLCAPVWMRVGYVSPFFFTSLLLYLLSLEGAKPWVSVGIAFSFLLAIESHKLWAPPLMLVVLAYGVPHWGKLRWATVIGLGATLFGALYAYKLQLHDAWHPEVVDWTKLNTAAISNLPEALWTNLTGFYYLEDIYTNPLLVTLAAGALLMVLVLAFVVGIKERPQDAFRALRWALVFCLIGILAYALVSRKVAPRYLMPWAQFAFLFIAISLWRCGKRLSTVVLSALLLISLVSTYGFRSYHFYTLSLETLEELRDECRVRDISTAYCTEPLASWQIIYYSREAIQCRYKGATDRYPSYVANCDSALTREGTASLIGRKWKVPNLVPDHELADGEVAIYMKLTAEELTALGFEFGDPWQKAP